MSERQYQKNFKVHLLPLYHSLPLVRALKKIYTLQYLDYLRFPDTPQIKEMHYADLRIPLPEMRKRIFPHYEHERARN
jgi:hypothetical protein